MIIARHKQGNAWSESAHSRKFGAKHVDIDVGRSDLQQCADAVMRLRAEYLYSHRLPGLIGFDLFDGERYRFRGALRELPGAVFQSVMTPVVEEAVPIAGGVGEGGIVNGLYSIHVRMLDGVEGGLTGVMLLNNGRILGGDASFYYLGTYTSENGRWKGQILSQEHTPAVGDNPILGGHEVGIGFAGTCDQEGALMEATALAGKRSLRMTAVLKLMRRA